MADVAISALPDAGALAGTELVPVVQTGATAKTTAQAIADLAPPPAFADVTSKPTTLGGYGITDAATFAQGALADSAVQPGSLSAVATSGDAADVAIADAGNYFTGTTVEDALQELGAGGGGSGTVTSVALAMPDIFGVTGSPVTTTGTLTATPVDPGADRIVFWDDSAGKWVYLEVGTGLSITDTTLAATASAPAWGDVTGTLSAQTDLQAALDAKIGPNVSIVTEASTSTMAPATHAGMHRYIRAADDVTFNTSQSYTAGMVFNIRATSALTLIGTGVTLTPPAGGTLNLDADMAVTVVMTSSSAGDVIGQTAP